MLEKPQTHTAEEKPIHSISIRPYWKINTLQATWRRLRANCSIRNDHGGLRTVGIGRERWKPPCNSARRARSRSRNGCFTRNRRALGRTDALEKSACSILRLWPLASGRGTGASAIQPYSTLHVDDMHNRARDIKVVREREREREMVTDGAMNFWSYRGGTARQQNTRLCDLIRLILSVSSSRRRLVFFSCLRSTQDQQSRGDGIASWKLYGSTYSCVQRGRNCRTRERETINSTSRNEIRKWKGNWTDERRFTFADTQTRKRDFWKKFCVQTNCRSM